LKDNFPTQVLKLFLKHKVEFQENAIDKLTKIQLSNRIKLSVSPLMSRISSSPIFKPVFLVLNESIESIIQFSQKSQFDNLFCDFYSTSEQYH
jgi:hypothetical protein